MNKLTLSLDDLHDGEFTGTKHDIGGRGHYVIIEEKNKDAAIEEMTGQFKKKVTKLFKPACKKCDSALDTDFPLDSCHICGDCCPGHQNCEDCELNG